VKKGTGAGANNSSSLPERRGENMEKQDSGHWKCKRRLEKRHGDINACKMPEERLAFLANTKPYEVIEGEGNCLLNTGINEIWDLVTGERPSGTAWAASTSYSVGDIRVPTSYYTCIYECTTAGTSGATEPTWPAVDGATVTDNTVVWTCRSDPRVFKNANARIGVGDSTTAADATQTDLQAAANKTYKGQDAGYPTSTAQKATFKSSFGDSEANYAWNEWVIKSVSGTPTNICLNRKVESLGTKPSGTWTLEISITLS